MRNQIELYYSDVETLNLNEKLLGTVNYKPVLPPIIMAICGCALFFLRNLYATILALFILGLVFVVQIFVKDTPVMDVYQDTLVFYDSKNPSRAFCVNICDVIEWNVNKTKNYSIFIKLYDGHSFTKETFIMGKSEALLRRVLPGKETSEIKAAENKKKKLVFRNPFIKKN